MRLRWPQDPTNAYLAKWGVAFAIPVIVYLVGWLFIVLTGWQPMHPE